MRRIIYSPFAAVLWICLGCVGRSEVVELTFGGVHKALPKWSPDSRVMVYGSYDPYSDPPEPPEIRIVQSESGSEIRVNEDGDRFWYANWSPDGGRLVLSGRAQGSSQCRIWKMKPDGTELAPLTDESFYRSGPEWSPDGESVAYLKLELGPSGWIDRLYRIPMGGGDETEVAESFLYDHWYRWSLDSRWLLYVAGDSTGGHIRKVDVETSLEIALTSGHNSYYYPEWSPDGNWVVASWYFDSQYGHTDGICLVSSDGASYSDLFIAPPDSPCAYPQFSPDGKWVAYLREEEGGIQIYKIRLDKRQEIALTSSSVDSMWREWSPDGRWIATLREDEAGYDQLWKVSTTSPAQGWLKVYGALDAVGVGIYEDEVGGALGAAPFVANGSTSSLFTHFAESSRWGTSVFVANPDSENAAAATATFHKKDGSVIGSHGLSIPPEGKGVVRCSEEGVTGSGWIEVTGDRPLVCMEACQDRISGDMAVIEAQEASSAGVVIPHFRESEAWYTGMVLLNPDASNLTVDLYAYGQDGSLLDQTTREMRAQSGFAGFVTDVFPALDKPAQGWVLAVPRSGRLAGQAVYGNMSQGMLAGLAAEDAEGKTEAYSPVVAGNVEWSTVLMLVNPNDADVTLDVKGYDEKGNLLTALSLPATVAGKHKLSGLASEWFDLTGVTKAWIDVKATPGGIVAGSFLDYRPVGTGKKGGFAAVSACEPGASLVLPHYKSTSRWWTLFSVANVASAESKVNVKLYGNDGWEGERLPSTLASKAFASGRLDEIFEIDPP